MTKGDCSSKLRRSRGFVFTSLLHNSVSLSYVLSCCSRKLFRINAYFCFQRPHASHQHNICREGVVVALQSSDFLVSCGSVAHQWRSHQKDIKPPKKCGKTRRGERQEGQPPIRGLGMGRATGLPTRTEPSARGPTVIWAGVGKGPSKCQTSVPRPH